MPLYGRADYRPLLEPLDFRDACYDLLASCKWSRSASVAALQRLLEQRDSLPRAGSAKLAIVARGFSPGLRRQAEEESVTLVGIDRLFG